MRDASYSLFGLARACPRVRARFALVVLVALSASLAGCADAPSTPREPVWVGPPEGAHGFASCQSQQALEFAIPGLRAEGVSDVGDLQPGVHRVDAETILWVWANYDDTQREDKLTRLNPITVHREPDGEVVVCTGAEIASEVFVDGERRTYDIGARYVAPGGWPDARTHVVVNWVVGCAGCTPPLRGNSTAHLDFGG